MEQVEMSIKTEAEMAATYVVQTDSEINVNFFKQNPEMLQSVKSEPSLANDARVKEEILEDSTQDKREQQCVHYAPTPAATGGVNEACSTSLGDLLNVKYESTEMDIGLTLLQDMDTINKNMSTTTEENTILDDHNEATPGDRVKEERGEGMWSDHTEQHCVEDLSTAAGAGSLYEANDRSHGDCLSVKQEPEDIDIGPTVVQHMDIHYALNKKTVDDFNKTMRCSGVKKLRDYLTLQKAMTKKRSHVIKSLPLKIHEHYLAALCRVHVMRLDVFQCDLCHEVHTDKRRLLQHLQAMHKCRPRTSLFVKNNKTNKRTATDTKIKCDSCGQTTTDYDEAHLKSCLGQQKGLQEHLLLQHQTTSSNSFRCDASGKTLRKPHLLSTHRKLHERNSATSGATISSVGVPSNVRRSEAAKAEPKPFKCDICDKGYSSQRTLNAHKRVHSGVGLSVCRICSARFNKKSNLTIHIRIHTGEKPYQCDTCNARFADSRNFTNHKKVHTGEKPYQCDTCNARFADSRNLTTHKRVHTGEKPYHCNTCNARFAQSSNLTMHKRVHTGSKPYQCGTCNARFTTNRALTIHKRVHTGEKPYQCGTCNGRFTTTGGLTIHKRVHTGEKPFKCTECGYKFAQNSNLNTHIRRRHCK